MIDAETLEAAAQKLEARAGNETYQKAWRTAAKIIRQMKPCEKLTDKDGQIGSE